MTRLRHSLALRQHFHTATAVCLLSLCGNAAADANDNTSDDETAELRSKTEFMIDDAHSTASELLNSFASQIDDYFADDVTTEAVSYTHLTLPTTPYV